jgi:hypothetical protein
MTSLAPCDVIFLFALHLMLGVGPCELEQKAPYHVTPFFPFPCDVIFLFALHLMLGGGPCELEHKAPSPDFGNLMILHREDYRSAVV